MIDFWKQERRDKDRKQGTGIGNRRQGMEDIEYKTKIQIDKIDPNIIMSDMTLITPYISITKYNFIFHIT